MGLLSVQTLSLLCQRSTSRYVPKCDPVSRDAIQALQEFLQPRPNILVLTGAGVSTESGIPDYRSKDVGMYARSNHRPVQHGEFVNSPYVRKRYWARNFVGWPRFSTIQANASHNALAQLERENRIQGIVTQNVDCLHSKAGSKKVVELHGNGYNVICLKCDYRVSRHDFQDIMKEANDDYEEMAATSIRPDGDVDINDEYIWNFNVPDCPSCGGILKTDIVFFGGSIPRNVLQISNEMISQSDGLLVLGSSLLVFSGYRLCLQANELELPIAIVNIGLTRGDHLANLKISARCGEIVPELVNNNRGCT